MGACSSPYKVNAPKMPKLATPLTNATVKNAKGKDKTYKLSDGGGMYLEIAPSGSKLWRMKYRKTDGKENRLSFGKYPDVSLGEAREKRQAARKLIAADKDPAEVRDEKHLLSNEANASKSTSIDKGIGMTTKAKRKIEPTTTSTSNT